MKKKAYLISILVLLFSISQTTGQEQTRFVHLGIEQGLSNGTVTSIVQDTTGYIWAATKNGLNRYDGTEFKVYSHENSALSANDISSLLIDSKGRMWIATVGGGVNLYNFKKDTFTVFQKAQKGRSGIGSNIVHVLYEDKRGAIWAGTDTGLSLFQEDKKEFITFLNQPASPDRTIGINDIWDLFEQDNGKFWIGTNGGGLYRFDRESKKFNLFEPAHTHKKTYNLDYIYAITAYGNNLLIGTNGNGLLHLDLKNSTATNFFAHTPLEGIQVILGLKKDRKQNLWVGTNGQGLIKVPKDKNLSHIQFSQDTNLKNTVSNNAVKTIFEDAQSNLWVGTVWKGIDIIEKRSENIHYYQSDRSNAYPILSIYKKDNALWLGTDGNGLSQLHMDSNTKKVYNKASTPTLMGRYIQCIHPKEDGGFMLGTLVNGLIVFRQEQGVIKQYKRMAGNANSLPYNDVRDIIELAGGNLWVATWGGGLGYYDTLKQEFTTFRHSPQHPNSISSNDVLSLYRDPKNNIWAATYGGGLNVLDSPTLKFKHFKSHKRDPTSIGSNYVFSLLKDIRNNYLWLGTKNGLSRFNMATQKFTNYPIGNTLGSNNVVSLQQDSQGQIWMATKNGIFRFDPQTGISNIVPKTLGEYHINASFKDIDGTMFFGGIEGAVSIAPDQKVPSRVNPKIVFTDFKLFNKSVNVSEKSVLDRNISLEKKITLSYDQNVFTLNFSNLRYPPELLQYAVKMDGFEKDWRNIGTQGAATYTNLTPGTYTFMVKALEHDASLGNAGISRIAIEILPPFWATWWAYLTYGLLTLLLLWAIRYYTLKWVEVKNNLRTEKIQREQEDELHRLKQRFFTNISHEIRTPLTLIMGTLNSLLKGNFNASEQKKIRTLKSSSNRLLNLVNELLNIRKLETGTIQLQVSENNLTAFVHEIFLAFSQQAISNEIRYAFKKSHAHIPVWFDKIQLEKTIYNLIVNAFKFTGPGNTIEIRVKMDHEHAYIRVKDTGSGIAKDKLPHIFERFYQNENAISQNLGFGIGLSITKEIIALHKGRIKVKSNPGKGSSFTIILPLGNTHFDSSQIIMASDGAEHIDSYTQGMGTKKIPDDEFLSSKILIVEDNLHLRNYLVELLSKDFEVQGAENGKMGLQMAIDQVPDCIISDVMMPVMDGIALCHELKSHIMTSHIPVILLTARTLVENIMEGYETGADDYLVKPFNEDVLKTRIKNLLTNRKQLRERYINEALLNPKDVLLTSPDQEFLAKLNSFVEKNIAEPEFSVDQLASDMAMSHSGIYKKLKALTGLTIIGFIKDFRLKRAAQMLEQHKFSITDIGFSVGYTDRKHFSQEFKKKFGVNPTEYGKMYRN